MPTDVELEIARTLPPAGCTPAQAQRYTRWLATNHYENFHVASWLLPRRLRQHFYNVYAYCRWADDLADEVAGAARARAFELVGAGTRSLLCGPALASRFHRSRSYNPRLRHSHRALPRPARGVSPGSACAPLRFLGRSSRLLPLFGESGGPAGAVSVRLPRRRAPAPLRRNLHRAAARQFLAGRFARP